MNYNLGVLSESDHVNRIWHFIRQPVYIQVKYTNLYTDDRAGHLKTFFRFIFDDSGLKLCTFKAIFLGSDWE